MKNCTLCPVACGADKQHNPGRCGVSGLTVAKYYLHPYEEPVLSPNGKSGTVFFGGCSLRCVFCQNYELSRARRGKAVTPQQLTDIFKQLEDMGAENIDLVTGDHVSDLIAKALSLYKPKVPVVYNSSGYCRVEALEALDPYIDIYLPDLKFYSPALSKRYTGRDDYFAYAAEAIKFMAKKPLVYADDGRMLSGILVRHLVMPCCTSDSLLILDFLQKALPEEAPVSLMRQYIPMGEAEKYPELNRSLTAREYRRVKDYALALGLNLYVQERSAADKGFIPDWDN